MEEHLSLKFPNLQKQKIANLLKRFEKIGVNEPGDMKYLTLNDISDCGLTSIEERKLIDIIRREFPKDETEEIRSHDRFMKELDKETAAMKCRTETTRNEGFDKQARNMKLEVAKKKDCHELEQINCKTTKIFNDACRIEEKKVANAEEILKVKEKIIKIVAEMEKMQNLDQGYDSPHQNNYLKFLKSSGQYDSSLKELMEEIPWLHGVLYMIEATCSIGKHIFGKSEKVKFAELIADLKKQKEILELKESNQKSLKEEEESLEKKYYESFEKLSEMKPVIFGCEQMAIKEAETINTDAVINAGNNQD